MRFTTARRLRDRAARGKAGPRQRTHRSRRQAQRPGVLAPPGAAAGLVLAAALLFVPAGAGPLFGPQRLAAQEPRVGHPAPGVRRVVRMDNERVLAVENSYDPGAEGPRHTHHWARLVYVLDGGTLELVAEDGGVQRLEAMPGMTVWRPAETHVVRNVGRTVVRTLEVEVKGGGGG